MVNKDVVIDEDMHYVFVGPTGEVVGWLKEHSSEDPDRYLVRDGESRILTVSEYLEQYG